MRIEGLQGVTYMDSLDGRQLKTDTASNITFGGEVDRIYLSTPPNVKVVDEEANKIITIAKSSLPDTVVWNPWVEKSRKMADFDDEEYRGRLDCNL